MRSKMHKIGMVAKRTGAERHTDVFRRVYAYLTKMRKEIYIEKHIADLLGLKKYQAFQRGKTKTDLILALGGDGTVLSIVRAMRPLNTPIFGINIGHLGFLSEIPPVHINKTLTRIFSGEYSIDKRLMLLVEIVRGKKAIHRFHALNEAVISQGTLARLIDLPAKVNGRKLTTYHADGLIIATPTGSTAYNLSAGGPIVYPTVKTIILTPICPHSFSQKPIVIPDDKIIEILIKNAKKEINISIDGQESAPLEYQDTVRIRRQGEAQFVRLPEESFFRTLREKLHWGKEVE